jgi:hypothetical protein
MVYRTVEKLVTVSEAGLSPVAQLVFMSDGRYVRVESCEYQGSVRTKLGVFSVEDLREALS